MSSQEFFCNRCKSYYEGEEDNCPKCKGANSPAKAEKTEQLELMRESIRASNRTTHAVRALSVFLLYQVWFAAGATLFFSLGFLMGLDWFFFVLGFITAIVGNAVSSWIAFEELKASKINGSFRV
jgi:hypothetical protein